jgi:outer membrane protein TolC
MILRIACMALLATTQVAAALPTTTLQGALTAAVSVSPAVAAADARVEEFKDYLSAAGSHAFPSLLGSYEESPQGSDTGATIAQRLATFGATINVNDYLARGAAVSVAAADLESARFARLEALRTERLKTIGLFFDVLRTDAELQLRAGEVRATTADLSAAQKRYDAGDAPHLDVTRARVSLSEASAAEVAASVAAQNARDALSRETSLPIATLSPPSDDGSVIAEQNATEMALARRPDVLQARSDVASSEAMARAARGALLPSIAASVGYTSGTDTGVQVHGPSGSVTVAIPLSAEKRYQLDAMESRVAQSKKRLLATERQVELDVTAQLRTIAMLRSNVAQARDAEHSALEELHAVDTGYAAGAASSLDVLEARRSYVDAYLAEAKTEFDLQQAIATLRETIAS